MVTTKLVSTEFNVGGDTVVPVVLSATFFFFIASFPAERVDTTPYMQTKREQKALLM